ncbi:TMAO reductase system periplasmic protein TorT [Pseudomonas sp. GW6]
MKTFAPLALASLLLPAFANLAVAEERWQFPVHDIQPVRDKGTAHVNLPEESTFISLAPSEVQKHRMCLLMPHTQDSIIMAYIYAAVDEAKRLGQALTVFDAGGYGNDSTQRAQFENCLTLGVDAILLQPINPGGWETDVAKAQAQGVKVINVTEGLDAKVDGRSLVDFRVNGKILGEHLKSSHPEGSPAAKVVVLPGGAGLPFVEDTVAGLREGLKGSSVEVVDVVYGGMDAAAQLKLVEDVLVAHPDLSYIVGNGIAIGQAVNVVAQRGMTEQVKLLTTYLDADLLNHIRRGRVVAGAAESSVMLKRLAVNLAVSAIEGKGPAHDLVPHVQLVTPDNANNPQIIQANFQPEGWKPVFKVD